MSGILRLGNRKAVMFSSPHIQTIAALFKLSFSVSTDKILKPFFFCSCRSLSSPVNTQTDSCVSSAVAVDCMTSFTCQSAAGHDTASVQLIFAAAQVYTQLMEPHNEHTGPVIQSRQGPWAQKQTDGFSQTHVTLATEILLALRLWYSGPTTASDSWHTRSW